MAGRTKTCNKCAKYGRDGKDLPVALFAVSRSNKSGLQDVCKRCQVDQQRDLRAKRRAERLRDEFAPLKDEDFAVGVGNVPETPGQAAERGKAAAEKRQEYNRRMGETLGAVHDVASGAAGELRPEVVEYLAILSEQERRFGNRRLARSTAISLAHEMLGLRMFAKAAEQYLSGKVVPAGYAARRKPPPEPGTLDRTLVVGLSDLHLGAELSGVDNPQPFRRLEESRRLAYIFKQALDYKLQYRDRTRCLVLLDGDVIQGLLQHDLRDGAPLTEQSIVFWLLMSQGLGLLAAHFPIVEVECQGGNHGRNKLRHPGRATSSKWDSFETNLYVGLRCMLSAHKNVHFRIPTRAVSLVDLYGSTLAVTHGDTEIPLGNPTSQHDRNVDALQRLYASGLLARRPDAWFVGHWHSAMLAPGTPTVVYNGMLVPPDGYARAQGYVGKPCGQWIWEAVKGYPVGDSRYVLVGPEQDRDESLDAVLKPPELSQVLEVAG